MQGLVRKYGAPDCWGTEEFLAAEKRIAAACKANGKVAGYWNSDFDKNIPLGFRFFVADGDVITMQAALAASIEEKTKKAEEVLKAMDTE